MKRALVIISLIFLAAMSAAAQEIKVAPSSVNAYSQGATTVFLTFTNVVSKRPVDACWCSDLIAADPDLGFKCNPASVLGCLPVRYDQSRLSSNSTYTDIMSIPPSVARRAYIEAASGGGAVFFYVRRFVSLTGGPDEFVPVTIHLSGNGADVPFSLTDVKLSWGVDKPVLMARPDEKLPSIKAEITYTGSGRLRGRWEIVKPGEELPSARDLLTEATLPIEERGLQRHYTELSRFNIFLPPGGKFILNGPEAWRVPSHIEGLYLVLLRIEATDDASPASISSGAQAIQTGGVAGFSLPVLRYYVGGASNAAPVAAVKNQLALLLPANRATIARDELIEFSWSEAEGVAFYRLEIEDEKSTQVLSAIVLAGINNYRAPSWLKDKAGGESLRWRVVAFDKQRNPVGETPKRELRLAR
ncbi:MAG TPA: hypothetical protein VNN73_15225 [Blastocatellia bacterium]|nr:hypothetical protein [Blastocatellia bacterium]